MRRRTSLVIGLAVLLAVLMLGWQTCRDPRSFGCRKADQTAGKSIDRSLVKRSYEAARAPAEWRFQTHRVTRPMLGRPVSRFNLYVDAAVVNLGRQRHLAVLVQRGERLGVSSNPFLRETQMRPDSCLWQVREDAGKTVREWTAGFIESRDGTRHTIVGLPLQDLKRSFLVMLFQDADPGYLGDEHVTLELDMTEYDWDSQRTMVLLDQARGLPPVWE